MSKIESLLTKIKKEKTRYIGILLLLTGLIFLLLTFYPLILSYVNYFFFPVNKEIPIEIIKEEEEITKDINRNTEVINMDPNFGIYIPKIKANSPIILNVDPYNEETYINALYKGVAHAKGSSTPNLTGNVFLFAHSAVNFYEQRKFNVYFYLLGELEKDDLIYISYKGEIYTYKVLETKKVDPKDIKYLGEYMDEDTLTIMTCWPAGTDFKRIIVTAVRGQ